MRLTLLDWSAIAGYLLITLWLGLYFRRRSGRSTEEYFVSGREVTWWLAGTSMVATTFAADTPLAVTGLVYTQGIAGNWLWWSFLPSGMMTVFLFARLWRRSGLLTDVQFAEMRYAGRPAAFLRGFRAFYLGLLMNCLILGWVTKAMTSIVSTALGTSDATSLALCIFFLMPFTGFYVSLGGLWGVLWTDLFQFVLKMGIVIAVAYYGVKAVGGMQALLSKLAALRVAAGPGASDITAVLPDFSRGLTAEALWTLPVLTFLVHLGVQWWAFWYPGAEPGGGGYIAQRIFSARDERHGLLSVLWFNIAHYALRPWPWILTALTAVVLYPGLARPETGYMLVATEQMPHALRGLLMAGFLAAFMSTVATQLAVRARGGRRDGRRLSAALVLVARECVERDLSHGHGARGFGGAAHLGAVLGQWAAGVCQEHPAHHRSHYPRLGCCDARHPARAAGCARALLPPGAA